MTRKYPLQEDYIRYKGVFDMKKLYRSLQQWFTNRGYRFMEKTYKHKPPETEIDWSAKRLIDDYIMYGVDLKFHIWELEDVEVVKDGKKTVMQQGRMKITLSGHVVTDYSGRWEETPMKQWLQKVYDSVIYKRDIEFKHLDNLYYVLYGLHQYVKKLLEMDTAEGMY